MSNLSNTFFTAAQLDILSDGAIALFQESEKSLPMRTHMESDEELLIRAINKNSLTIVMAILASRNWRSS